MPRKPVKKSAAKARTKAAARATARKSAPLPPHVPTEHDRFDYSAIIDRPSLPWPNGARVAVWVIPNIEHFLFNRAVTRLHRNLPVDPDVLNYSWRDYGVRVGIWRMMEMMERYGVKGTVALNSDVCKYYPRIIEAGNKLGWEWMGHGTNNSALFARPVGSGAACADQGGRHNNHQKHRQDAARLAQPGAQRDGPHPRYPCGERHRVCRQLGK